jgi:transposase
MRTQSNKINSTGQNLYIGFDVHKKDWRVTILTEKIAHKTFSQPPSPETLHSYLIKNFPGCTYHSVYEAGFCGYWIHNRLVELGINSIVVNPADVPTTGKERDQKTDKRDSIKLARSLRAQELTPIYVPSLKTLEDRSLIRLRSTLVKDLTRNKNRVKSFLHFHGIQIPESYKNSHWSKKFINWLQSIEMKEQSGKMTLDNMLEAAIRLRETLLKVTKQVQALSISEPYKTKVDLLRSISGIGIITSMIILTELEDIQRFSNIDHLCGFVGLVPSSKSSGEKDGTGDLTSRGHSFLRSCLIESAWVAARTDPYLAMCYNKYCRRMKSNEAIIRIAKKLVARINFVLKNNCKYDYTKNLQRN